MFSAQLSATNPLVLTNITAMNTTVNAIVPSITTADNQLKSALTSLSTGFARFNQCGWIGTSFVNIRTSLCGSVADTINVLWVCCGVLGFVLMYLPIVIIKAEKRFKRVNKDADNNAYFAQQKKERKTAAQQALNASAHPQTYPAAAATPAAAGSSHDVAIAILPSMSAPCALPR